MKENYKDTQESNINKLKETFVSIRNKFQLFLSQINFSDLSDRRVSKSVIGPNCLVVFLKC